MIAQTYIAGTTAVNIARSIEDAVASARLAPDQLLPPVRSLAAQLEVSPATVAAAYRLLQERGIVVTDGRRGTRIRRDSPLSVPSQPPLPPHVRNLGEGNPDLALLPDLREALRRKPPVQKLYGDELNDPSLLTLARKQFAADGVPAERVAVVSGALDGLERVLREHTRPGDRVAVEDPCFTGILDLLNALSLKAVPVRVDDEGCLPSDLRLAIRSAAALIVTPRAQNPTGAAFSPARGRQLRKLLQERPDMLVIEDDHAGPVAGAPYVTLASAERERWAVVRSVSKSLGPDLRLAVLAGDPHTIARVEGRQTLGIRWVSHILQSIVASLWSDSKVLKGLERAAKAYGARRKALLSALRAEGIDAHAASGLNVWIPVPEESAIVQALFQRGWAVNAGERYRLETPPAIRVTIATMTKEEAARFATDLAEILRPSGRSTRA